MPHSRLWCHAAQRALVLQSAVWVISGRAQAQLFAPPCPQPPPARMQALYTACNATHARTHACISKQHIRAGASTLHTCCAPNAFRALSARCAPSAFRALSASYTPNAFRALNVHCTLERLPHTHRTLGRRLADSCG